MQLATTERSAAARAAVIASLDVLGGDPDERFDRITRAGREAFGVPMCFLNMVGSAELQVVSPRATGTPPVTMPLREAFCTTTVASSEPLVVPDALADERFAELEAVRGERGVRFYAGVPISTPGGTRIGSLCMMDTAPRVLDAGELELLTELGHWVERVLAEGRRVDDIAAVVRAARPAPVDIDRWEVAARSHDVEGGFHDWVHDEAAGTLTITVADVLGDGHGSGLLAASVRSALRARAGLSPETAVRATEEQVAREFAAAGSHVALFHGRLDLGTGVFEWVDAGLGVAVHVAGAGDGVGAGAGAGAGADGAGAGAGGAGVGRGARAGVSSVPDTGGPDGESGPCALPVAGETTVLRSRALPIGLHAEPTARAASTVVIAPGDAVLVATPEFLHLHDGTLETLRIAGARLREAGDLETFFDRVDVQAGRQGVQGVMTTVVVRRESSAG